jgi:isovaleryl-CoA dehydrogenase
MSWRCYRRLIWPSNTITAQFVVFLFESLQPIDSDPDRPGPLALPHDGDGSHLAGRPLPLETEFSFSCQCQRWHHITSFSSFFILHSCFCCLCTMMFSTLLRQNRRLTQRRCLSLFTPTDEHATLRSTLRNFVAQEVEPQAQEFNAKEKFNLPLFKKLGDLGLLGLTVSEEYGGSGFDATAVAIVHEELSYSDPALCLAYLAHSLLLVNNLSVNASHEQKERLLPDLCSGERIGGMCMSEPGAGTDVLGMSTKAVLEGDTWTLNGTKMWITNGTLNGSDTGDVFLVYARTGENRQDITQFLVEKDMKGFSLGQQIKDKLGMRASMTAELVFDQVKLDNSHVVGNVNEATLCMMRNLEIERIGLAAMAIGIARRCLDDMKSYAVERKAFGKKIFEFGQIQSMITTSYAEYMAGKSYVYQVASELDLNSHGNGLNADGCKLFSAKMSKQVADCAIQVLGGYGYVGEYNVERFWRDSKLLEIGGGTNESHHKNMSRDLMKINKLD